MAYPASFWKLVLIGGLWNDIWNTTLSLIPPADAIVGMGPVSQATCDDVAGVVHDWWNGIGGGAANTFSSGVSLTEIKLNRLDTAGHYQDDPTRQHVFVPTLFGASAQYPPPNTSVVSSLLTDATRGRGHRGRMYMPPYGDQGAVGSTTGTLTAAKTDTYAANTANLITRLNTYGLAVFRVGVASKAGSGVFRPVTAVAVGSVVDTMRSRRNKDVEVYSTHSV